MTTEKTKTHRELLTRMLVDTEGKREQENRWGYDHCQAWMLPRIGPERALVAMIKGAVEYADWHAERYEANIGADPYTGECWERIIRALNDLLTCDTGRLSTGTLNTLLLDMLKAEGFGEEAQS